MPRNNQYHERVNRVLDYIGQHLHGELSLNTLSQVACFSPFHFHRIFQAVTGETLNSHVRRVRLERAALLMKTTPRKTNYRCRYRNRLRRNRGILPRVQESLQQDRQLMGSAKSAGKKSKICKAPEMLSFYSLEELENWKAAASVQVRVDRFSAFRYVYIRIFEPYGNTRLVDAYPVAHRVAGGQEDRHSECGGYWHVPGRSGRHAF